MDFFVLLKHMHPRALVSLTGEGLRQSYVMALFLLQDRPAGHNRLVRTVEAELVLALSSLWEQNIVPARSCVSSTFLSGLYT